MNVNRTVALIVPSMIAIVALAGIAAPAAAQEYGQESYGPADEFDYAPVVRVEPLVRTIQVSVPRQECYTETRYLPVRRRETPAAGSMIVGGLIGAVIGHQFDDRRSRNVGSVAGAVIGSAIGHEAAQRNNEDRYQTRYAGYDDREVRAVDTQRCEMRREDRIEQRTEGYRVTYRYHGRLYTTQMPRDPGDRVQVRVNVEPVG